MLPHMSVCTCTHICSHTDMNTHTPVHNTDIYTCKEEKQNKGKMTASSVACALLQWCLMASWCHTLLWRSHWAPGSGESSKTSAVALTGTSAHWHERRQNWALQVSLSPWRPLSQPLCDVCTCQQCLEARGVHSWAVTVPEVMWESSVLPTHTQTLAPQLRTALWCDHSSQLGMVCQKKVPAVWPGHNLPYHTRLASFPVCFRAKTKISNMLPFPAIQCLYHVWLSLMNQKLW